MLGYNMFAYCLNNPVNRTDTQTNLFIPPNRSFDAERAYEVYILDCRSFQAAQYGLDLGHVVYAGECCL